MPFRSVFPDSDPFTPGSLRKELFSWQVRDTSADRCVSLRTNAADHIDVYQINFEIISQPEPRIRISAEIFDEGLLKKMRAENNNYYSVPKARSRSKHDKGVSVCCYCDFGADATSQDNARNFLTALVVHSKQPEFFMPDSQKKALMAFSNWIFLLTHKYKAPQLALGTDWIDAAPHTFATKKLEAAIWNQKKSIFTNCGLFGLAITTSVVALTVLKNTF